MRLNHDCVRVVLLEIEDMQMGYELDTKDLQDEDIPGFTRIDALYTISKLLQAGYLDGIDKSTFNGPAYVVRGLSWDGHQFLDNIRDDGIWQKVKATVIKTPGVSLPILAELATSYVKQRLGLN